jgi:hypothetical protein
MVGTDPQDALRELDAAYARDSSTWALAKLHAGLDPTPEAIEWMMQNRRQRAELAAALGPAHRMAAEDGVAPPPTSFLSWIALRAGPLCNWFGFAESRPRELLCVLPGRAAPAFRATLQPAGGPYRELVQLALRCTDGLGIDEAELIVERCFIDSPADAMFARDLIGTFLGAMSDAADASALGRLRAELLGAGLPVNVIRHRDARPAAAAPGRSAALETILGRREAATLGCGELRVECYHRDRQSGEPGARRLVVRITRP